MNSDSEEEEPQPNIQYDLNPIHTDWGTITTDPDMWCWFPTYEAICTNCGTQAGEVRVDGMLTTPDGKKEPLYGTIAFRLHIADGGCHCDCEPYEEVVNDVVLKMRSAWHDDPEGFPCELGKGEGLGNMSISLRLPYNDALYFQRLLIGKADVEYLT